MIKLAVFSALVAVALADKGPHPHPHPARPVAPYPPPPPAAYKPAPYRPPPYKPAQYGKEEPLPPQPFAYQYGVKDDYSGAAFEKTEAQDAHGNLEGSYRVALPDGRTQIVTYHADHENGYVADVQYEGQAVYPPEPKEGYGQAHPKYPARPHPPPPNYAPAGPKYVPIPPKYPA